MSDDLDTRTDEWPARPWIMAAVGAAGGLLVYLLADDLYFEGPISQATFQRMAAATAVGIATVSFLITAERRRLAWAIAFALGWGAVMGLVGYFTASYDGRGELVGFPFLSGLFALAVAAPLFQTVRDEGRWSLPYARLHRYAWTDAIIGGASLAFTGLTFLLSWLLASLFDAIGIALLKDLLYERWFAAMLAGTAFGAASAVLRQRDNLLGTLQRLVMAVFAVLAPILAAALALYLVALPATGFAGLWRSGLPETPLLLSTAAFAVLFLNAIIGDSPDDRNKGRIWRATEAALLLAVLPLGVLALVSMMMRVDQYGWTPGRLWGVIASTVAIAYGIAAWAAALRGRRDFDRPLRDYQKGLAVALGGLALFLALPIVDFGAISTRSQLARLEAGKVGPDQFDWAALAFDFGPAGRAALRQVERSGPPLQRQLAATALGATNRWSIADDSRAVREAATIERHVRVVGAPIRFDPPLRRAIADAGVCRADSPCLLQPLGGTRFVLVHAAGTPPRAQSQVIDLTVDPSKAEEADSQGPIVADLRAAPVELRTVTRRQMYIDGKPVGQPFE